MINPGEKNKKPVEWCREAELNRRPTDYESDIRSFLYYFPLLYALIIQLLITLAYFALLA
ncbi:hypothetical protein BMS3Abin11_00161 [bacterium BMS3Abin11]|nr:hypothetical protein BMS3Abin11_00161 [bacterium BMS3Abin11]